MKSRGSVAGWLGVLALAAMAASCAQSGAPDDTTTVRSAVNSNVAVTVRDGASVLQPNVEVFAVKTNGSIQASAFTNASGVATLSLPANSYRFKVNEAGSDFFSGASGHCTTPSCTTAQITITRVNVTIALTDGTPLTNRSVWWETPGGQTGGYVYSDANGHSLIAVPAGSYAFFNEVNGWEFPSGSAGHCVIPGCTTATIVETAPVTVTVKDTSAVRQPGESVVWQDDQGAYGGGDSTDAQGMVVMSVPSGVITFKVGIPAADFKSAPCQVPGCTAASVTVSAPIAVTVVDTGGTPMTGRVVSWETATGASDPGVNTNASGIATVIPPLELVRFKVSVDGTTFYSATSANCMQPACASATILVSQQSVVTVLDGSGNPISGRAVTPVSTEGVTSANKTTNTSGQATFRLPFAHWQFKAKCTGTNETFFSGNAGHCFISGGCLTAKIKMPCGQCTTAANGASCDDQSPCSGSSTCQSHFCTGANPMNCAASDQCHDAGACSVETATCSNPPKANGTSCSDGNGCTQTDTCQAGACSGGNMVTCPASDQCHNAGTCNPGTGLCSNPAKTDGTSCSDGTACTVGDSCQSGACTGTPVTCTASDQCHDTGTCNSSTGSCSNPSKPNGTACNDGDACTQTDACQGGACTGANQVTCQAINQCHGVGTCNPSTGICSHPELANGTGCNDGNNCTSSDMCTAGVCTGTPTGTCQLNAPPIDRTVATDFSAATSFLYSGSSPIQTGVASGTIDLLRVAVIRGLVTDRSSAPLAGAKVTIHGHPEYGQTTTRADGMFDIAVNGGGLLTIEYEISGRFPAQRQVNVPKRDYTWATDVVLVSIDPEMTVVALPNAAAMQVVQGSVVSDNDGSRQATLLVPAGTNATMVLPDGTQTPMSQIRVRATEYTVGPSGLKAMPAPLPPTVGYTYAVEYSTDEAISAGAREVLFDRPVIHYVDNFIGFPVGGKVPSGFYDRQLGAWIGSSDGRIVKIVDVLAGLADVDIDGDDIGDDAAALVALGIDDNERVELASLYPVGKELWRVPVRHFSAWDFNWGSAPPPDMAPPNQAPPVLERPQRDPCDKIGSIIECENQVLGESVPVVGVPFELRYSTSRVPGFRTASIISIPVSGASVPASVSRIEVEVQIAGKRILNTFPRAANQTTTFEWDGKDAYGRTVQGPQTARVAVRDVYPTRYMAPAELQATGFPSWGAASGVPIGDRFITREGAEANVQAYSEIPLGGWDWSALAGLGGWDLAIHHTYSAANRQLIMGSGEVIDGIDGRDVISRVAGVGTWAGGSGDGGPARDAEVYPFAPPVVAADGSVFFGDDGLTVRKISPTGTITTIAGGGFRSTRTSVDGVHSDAEGFPATEAELNGGGPPYVALGPDGSVFFTTGTGDGNTFVLRVGPDGILTRVLGSWQENFIGDPDLEGVIATDPTLAYFYGLWVAGDGTLYWSTSRWIRKVTPDGVIMNVAGTGAEGVTADGLPARGNPINAIDPALASDGSIYFIQQPSTSAAPSKVRRIGPDGILRTVAGNGVFVGNGQGGTQCFAPFDGPALSSGGYMHYLRLALGPDDSVYISDSCGGVPVNSTSMMGVIRKLDANGQLHTIAGGGPTPFNQMTDLPGNAGYPLMIPAFMSGNVADVTLARQWPLYVYGGMAVTSDAVYFAGINGGNRYPSAGFIYRLSSGLPGVALGATQVAAPDGSEIFEFSAGRHLRTIDALTGALKYQFGYGSTGLLNSVTNADGLVTTIARESSGAATAIIAPNGQTTTLSMDLGGNLAQIAKPDGNAMSFTYGATGLLATHTDLRGANHAFTFDGQGRLVRDDGAGGSFWKATRTVAGQSFSVDMETAEGRHEVHVVSGSTAGSTRTVTASGASATTSTGTDGSVTATKASGVVATIKMNPDPRLGAAAPYISTRTIRTPAGLTNTMTASRTSATNSGGLSTQTDTVKVNGRSTIVSYDGSTRTRTITTPLGRQATATYDAQNHLTRVQGGGLAPIALGYNPRGRLTSITIGTGDDARITTMDYDLLDRLNARTDPAGNLVSIGYDAADHVISAGLPGASAIVFGVNGAGDLMSVTPPDRPLYSLQRSPAGQETLYTPPTLGPAATSMQFTYNLDHQLTDIQRLDGSHVVYSYDSVGRVSAIGGLNAAMTFVYGTGANVSAISSTSGENLSFTYDGDLPVGESWIGPIAGSVTRTFNADFAPASIQVNGSNPVSYSYDSDGLMAGVGTLSIGRDSQSGLVTSADHGVVQNAYTYNAFSELTGATTLSSGQPAMSIAITRDRLGRVATKTESILGEQRIYQYGYDNRGRLSEVRRDAQVVSSYTYDTNGNCISKTTAGQTVSSVYNQRDQLLTSGSFEFDYNSNGEQILKRNTSSGSVTTYSYGDFGELRAATTPSSLVVEYIVDAKGRRIGKRQNGTLVQGFLYDGPGAPVAELDSLGNVVSRFVYSSRPNVPEYLIKGGIEYRIVTDDIGSPRLVINSSNGAIMQRIDYDEFGRIVLDSNPGFQPFGFAGGLLDRDTGLVHFGAREYDSEFGRWTTTDPIRFDGGQSSLYAYVNNDPVNNIDPSGEDLLHYLAVDWSVGWLDFDTRKDGSVYYSGDLNRIAAQRFAKCTRKQTIYDTQGGRFLQEMTEKWEAENKLSRREVLDLWAEASERFAMATHGRATAFVDPAGGHDIDFSFWLQHEFRILDKRKIKIDYFPPDYNPCPKECR